MLWDWPLGKTIRGMQPELFEELTVSAHLSKTHFSSLMRAAAVKYEKLTSRIPEQPPGNNQVTVQFQEASIQPPIRTSENGGDGIALLQHVSQNVGGAAVGTASQGGKEVTLAKERKLEVIRQSFTYVTEDSHRNGMPDICSWRIQPPFQTIRR